MAALWAVVQHVFLPGLGMKESGLVFHSLRHTMVTRLAQAGVPEPLFQEIVGHERQGVAQQVYFKEGSHAGTEAGSP